MYKEISSELYYNLKQNLNIKIGKVYICKENNPDNIFNIYNTNTRKVINLISRIDLASKTFIEFISPTVCASISLLPILLTVVIIHIYNICFEKRLVIYFAENIILFLSLLSFLIPFFLLLRNAQILKKPVRALNYLI